MAAFFYTYNLFFFFAKRLFSEIQTFLYDCISKKLIMFNMTEKKYFKTILFVIGFLFLVTCFSLIFCIVKASSVDEAAKTSHVMSIVYLLFHLIIESAVFYYSFKAMTSGSTLIKVVMYSKDDIVNKKSKRNALIILIVSLIIALYFLVLLFPINIFLSFFSLALRYAIFNFFTLLATLSAFFYFYKKQPEDK